MAFRMEGGQDATARKTTSLEGYLWRSRRGKNWDQKVFMESYDVTRKKLEAAGVKKPELLMQYFADCFFDSPDQDYSKYEDEFSMPIPKSDLRLAYNPGKDLDRELQGASHIFFLNELDMFEKSADVEVATYGQCRFYNIGPGDFVFIPNEEINPEDIIGSNRFTACTALIVRTEAGIFFSHITTGPQDVKKGIEKCQREFGPEAKIEVIRPEWKVAGKLHDFESSWNFLDETEGVEVHKYPRIEYQSDRPEGVNEFSILIMEDRTRVVGVEIHKDKKRKLREDIVWDYHI